jgi:hypothetical protein
VGMSESNVLYQQIVFNQWHNRSLSTLYGMCIRV